ncbi:unnamed protein product [Colias eurytheme]|nr:unnamed protein product [Colias eurytheme]
MVGCSVLGCKSRSERKIEGITFHTFPSNIDKKKWLDATGRENWLPTKYSKICSIHFDDDSLLYKNKRVQLKPHSVPTKYIHTNPNQGQSSNQDDVPLIHPSRSISDHTRSPVSTNLCPQQENTPLPSTSQESKENFNTSLSPPNKRRKVIILQEVQNIQARKSTVGGASYGYHVKRLENLLQNEKTKCNNLRKKLRAVRESKRRLVKKTAHLRDILIELKCKLQMQSEELDLLSRRPT